MSLRVRRLHTRIVSHALRADRIIVSPAGRHDASQFLIVEVEDVNGTVGYGEAATTPLWSGETAQTAQAVIEEVLAPLLLDATFDHPREALSHMDKAVWGNPFCKAAVDCALWDVWAKNQNARVADLVADRKVLSWLPTRASVGCYDVETTVRIAREFWEAGIRTLKFKVGVPQFDDAARLRAVREVLGDAPVFTVDANGAYQTLDEALRAIEIFEQLGVTVVEQPTPRDRISLMAQIKQRANVSIMADESVFTSDDLREVLDLDACDIVSLYPGKNGGFSHALEMAQMVKSAGKICALGSNLETDLGQAAMIALAASQSAFPEEQLFCDLPAALFYQHSSLSRPLTFKNGGIQVPSGIGFDVAPISS